MNPNLGLINTVNLNIYLSSRKTQVQQFKKEVSNTATDSIMSAHKKTQLTKEKINCEHNYSSCNSPLSKILMFTIFASNASSSSTKVFTNSLI